MPKTWAVVCVLLGFGAGGVRGADESLIDQNVLLQFGGFLLSTDTTVRVDPEDDRFGTEVDLEEDLGFDDADRFRFDGLWRISPRHHLRGQFFRLDRSAERDVNRTIEFGDLVIPVNGSVSAELETQIGQLAYEYAFLRGENHELAASLGVHMVWFDLELAARGPNIETRTERAETTAPLPVLGLRGLWRVGGNLYVEASAQYFEAGVDEYDGSIQDFRAALLWMPWRNFGFGAGYNHFRVDVEVDDTDFDGKLRWEYGGPILFANLAF
jgi:hypothetical protein